MFIVIFIFSYLIGFVNVMPELNKNIFLYTSKIYAKSFNISNCWVCIATPTNSGEGIPFLTIPFNASEIAEWYIYQSIPRSVVVHSGVYSCEKGRYKIYLQKCINLWKSAGYPLNTFSGWHQLKYNPNRNPQYISLPTNIKQKGSICLISNHSEGMKMGNSVCTNYLDVNTAYKCTQNVLQRTKWSSKLTGIRNITNNKTFSDQWYLEDIYLYSACNGTYFICDDRAYSWLPKYWSGSCYLGYLVPAIRHLPHLPYVTEPATLRNKHSIILRDAIYARIIPFYWEVRVANELNKITTIIQNVADYTAGVTCALTGAECCTFIPDNSKEVKDLASHIQKEIKKLDPPPVISLWDKLCGWLGHTGMSTVRIILFSCVAGFIIYITCQCIKCIKELFAKCKGPIVRMIHTNPTAPPLDEIEMKYYG
ncbi:uncharacterized protein [Scyliorhinus torazame]|uniref:uncharacterized protein n=1 Tax=Scyliorhinus torazame TaxID=75743 RepID=UPI003B5A7389